MSEFPEGPVRIALIEPESGEARWIAGMVQAGSMPADVADAVAAERPDIADAQIILYGISRLGRLEREAVVKLHAGFPLTPLIVLAGPDAAMQAGEAVGLGAQHMILKSELTPAKLSSLIRYYSTYARALPVADAA